MDETTRTDELLEFFKAMADASRLKIIGVLAQQPSTVEQLAAMLDLSLRRCPNTYLTWRTWGW